jgi:hypothetical protein
LHEGQPVGLEVISQTLHFNTALMGPWMRKSTDQLFTPRE